MTETPILTKKQQKSSLSAKKNKTKETIRNVLATPYSKYWPLVSEEYVKPLFDILSKQLPRIIPERVKIPWKQLKDLPRAERKLFRKEYLEKHTQDRVKITLGERDGLIFGVNDTTKAIEKEIVKSVLIADDVQPKLMVEHVIDQSVLLRIPVLVVPELRTLLRDTCGLSSIVIAFTNSAKYKTVREAIEKLYTKYPVPRDHINFQRSLDLINSSVIFIEDSIIENDTRNIIDDNSIDQTITSIEDSVVQSEQHSVYLYRETKDKRLFIPGKSSDDRKNNSKMGVDSTGFLSFSVDPSPVVEKQYKSLKIKKIKGDSKRNKRKIEEMKKKTKRNKKIKKNN